MGDWVYSWYEAFVVWLKGLWQGTINFLVEILVWSWDWIKALGYFIFEDIVNATMNLVILLPRPSFYANAETQICESLNYLMPLLGTISFSAPLTLIFGAFVIRFAIRRIPFIG